MNLGVPTTVTLLRGHHVNPWELGSWRLLGPGYRVRVLVTSGSMFETDIALEAIAIGTLGDHT